MTEHKLTTGRIYDVEACRAMFIGWSDPDADGYCLDYYFYAGRYLGPDKHGVEPLISEPEEAEL